MGGQDCPQLARCRPQGRPLGHASKYSSHAWILERAREEVGWLRPRGIRPGVQTVLDLRPKRLHSNWSSDLLNELVLLDEALHVDALVVGDFAQLLNAQLLEVGVLDVDFLLVPQLAHLRVLLLHARAQPLSVDATRKRTADVTLHTARRARLRVTHADVVAHGLVLALGRCA